MARRDDTVGETSVHLPDRFCARLTEHETDVTVSLISRGISASSRLTRQEINTQRNFKRKSYYFVTTY